MIDKEKNACYTIVTMIYDNVCRFIPTISNYGDVHVLHFASEGDTMKTVRRTLGYYRMHIVTDGTAVFGLPSGEKSLKKGDVFFALPAVPYSLQPSVTFRCLYIDCLGDQINQIANNLKLGVNNCVFSGFGDIIPAWEYNLSLPQEVSDLASKSALYAAFAAIGTRTLPTGVQRKETTTAALIKKYIDENFTSPDLSLKMLGKQFSYNPKYISSLLTSQLNITFKTYLNEIRIQNACALMRQGFSGVKNLAALCGFTDPLYFSKTFKAHVGIPPTEFCNNLQKPQ